MTALDPVVHLLLATEPPPPPSGVIPGGWAYVWASYIVTWAVVAGYGASLWLRLASRRSEAGGRP